MISKMATLKDQLSRAVMNLKPIQSFNIIFYYDGPKATSLDTQLVAATADNKRRALKWLEDISPAGQTDPTPAIQMSFKQNAQLIYFLSDGEFNNLKSYKEIEDEMAKLNPGNKVKVNTILFETFDKDAEERHDPHGLHHRRQIHLRQGVRPQRAIKTDHHGGPPRPAGRNTPRRRPNRPASRFREPGNGGRD